MRMVPSMYPKRLSLSENDEDLGKPITTGTEYVHAL